MNKSRSVEGAVGAGGAGGWAPRWRFVRRLVAKAVADGLNVDSAALAFITILSLIPLLATFSAFSTWTSPGQQARWVESLTAVLPYSEATIVAQLEAFLTRARTIGGIGFLGLLLTVLLAFNTLDQTVNRIWQVEDRRPLRMRLLSFTLVLFWGPVVIGTTYTGLLALREQALLRSFVPWLSAHVLPFLVTALGLTMLYRLVPYASVRLSSALAGGLTAAVLLALLRQGLHLSVGLFQRISIIYGSFGLVLFFMISVQLAWWIVLLGNEITYGAQHRQRMARARRPVAPMEGPWLGLLALGTVIHRFRDGGPVTPWADLADRLRLTTAEVRQVVAPLLEAGMLTEVGRGARACVLSCDPYRVTVAEVLAVYEPPLREVLEAFPPELAAAFDELRASVVGARADGLATRTLASLMTVDGPPDVTP